MRSDSFLNDVIVYLYQMMLPCFLLAPGLALAIWAHLRVGRGLKGLVAGEGPTGAEVASQVLSGAPSEQVTIGRGEGPLGTIYDPRRGELWLIPAIFDGRSPAARARAAHEAGHALGPRWLAAVRLAILFGTGLSSLAAGFLIVAGFLLDFTELAITGASCYLATVGALVALLPVEYWANWRARSGWDGPGLDMMPLVFLGAALPSLGRGGWPVKASRLLFRSHS